MKATSISGDSVVAIRAPASTALQELLRTWIELCNQFRQRERREMVEQVPAPTTVMGYRDELKWMIRVARALLNLASDPDSPAQQFVPEISGKLLQLEESWRCLNNSLSDAEADAILQRAFSDEARTGSPA